MITVADYFMGRDKAHPKAMRPEYRANAEELLEKVNRLLEEAKTGGVTLHLLPRKDLNGKRTHVSSGWRPPAINARTANAAPMSKHMTCHAVDVYDPEGDLDEWLMAGGPSLLERFGLYMEHPSATKSWSHLQDLPPGSKRRVFYP